MNRTFVSIVAVLALLTMLALTAFALPLGVDSAPHVLRGATPWHQLTPTTYWPSDWQSGFPPQLQDTVLDTINVPPGGKLTMRMEVAYIAVTENTWPVPISGYQIGSGFNLRAGELGIQLCSNLCSGALAPSDGETFVPPSPPVTHMIGFPAGAFDYHYVPQFLVSAPVTQAVPGGPLEVKGNAYTSMQDWNGELNPNQSHGYTFSVIVVQRAVWGWAPIAPSS